jgi:(S)-ureidoglycine-glyoxylate aminotransferase
MPLFDDSGNGGMVLEQHQKGFEVGAQTMGLEIYGDPAHKMSNVTAIRIPASVDGEGVRQSMRVDFEIEIGTAFGPLAGKVWRIGAMARESTRHLPFTTATAACCTPSLTD